MSPKAGEPTRAQILAAATTLFAEHGYDGVSLRAIAQESGVSQPLIHHHFGSKQELWDLALGSIVESFAAAQAAQFELGEGGAPIRRAVRIVLLLGGILLWLTGGLAYVAPFVYALF